MSDCTIEGAAWFRYGRPRLAGSRSRPPKEISVAAAPAGWLSQHHNRWSAPSGAKVKVNQRPHTEIVEHFHQPYDQFARLDNLLKPGGWLAVMTRFQVDDAAFAGWHYRRDPTHVVFYREQTFRTIARQHGWSSEFPCPNVALLRKAER